MKLVGLIEFLRRHLRWVVRLSLVLLVLLIVADGLPFVVDKSRAHTAAERLPGFWSLFGFGACVLIVVFAKTLGAAGISAKEDHYDE
jgi:hypothetical protein